MKLKIFCSICFSLLFTYVSGQQFFPTYKIIDGDSIIAIQLNEAVVVRPMKFKNDTLRYNYNQLKRYVKTVIPYANEAVFLFNQIDSAKATMTKAAAKRYVKSKEKEIKKKFEDPLKKLNYTQGKLLVKLINKKANSTCFDMLNSIHSSIKTNTYQAWAKLHGINLNESYNPQAPENRDLERILKALGNP
jgi:hypothetical protein